MRFFSFSVRTVYVDKIRDSHSGSLATVRYLLLDHTTIGL